MAELQPTLQLGAKRSCRGAAAAHGNFAAATSTGGITFKRVGRVGDSPLLGSGCYADNTLGAISTTGHGESILRYTLASRVLLRMAFEREIAAAERGGATAKAIAAQLEQMYTRTDGGSGGAICIGPSGELGIAFTSSRMAWAFRNDGAGPTPHGIERGTDAAPGARDRRGRPTGSLTWTPVRPLQVPVLGWSEAPLGRPRWSPSPWLERGAEARKGRAVGSELGAGVARSVQRGSGTPRQQARPRRTKVAIRETDDTNYRTAVGNDRTEGAQSGLAGPRLCGARGPRCRWMGASESRAET